MSFPVSRPHVTDSPHWQKGDHSEHPHVATLLGVKVYSETGYVQAHVTTGCDPERGQYLKGPDGRPVDSELVDRGWLLVTADGGIE